MMAKNNMINECQKLTTVPFDKEWKFFIDSMPNATIFHHPTWINTISEVYGYKATGFVLRDSFGEICAALPVAYVDSLLTGRRWVSYPFSDYCFPLYRSESDLDLFYNSMLIFCEEEKIDPLEIHWSLPQLPHVQARPEAVLHLLKLDPDIDKIFADVHHKHRQHIRHAEKQGVRIEWGHYTRALHTFYNLHTETRRRQGVPVQPWKFFEQLGKNVIETGHGFILLAYHEDQCIAGGVFLHYNKTLTFKYSASRQEMLHFQPNKLIAWKAIQWGCENGYTLFDYGKTDTEDDGLRTYKSRWGAQEQPLIYSSISNKPFHTRTGHLNSIVEGVIKNSPLWVCRLSGEFLYKHFA